MVISEEKRQSDILTLPCMINSFSLVDGQNADVESRSGLMLFSSSAQAVYVIATITTEIDCNDVTMMKQGRSHQVIFKVSEEVYKVDATMVWACKCSSLASLLHKVFQPRHQWTLSYENSESDVENQISVLSSFALFRLNMNISNTTLAAEAFLIFLDQIRPGTPITTMTYPFGPDSMEIFSEVASSGIVSSVSTADEGSLFMIDARCLPGSEGGGVFKRCRSSGQNLLIGIIISPMCWKSQELVGISICCSLRSVISSLQESLPQHNFVDEHIVLTDCLSSAMIQSHGPSSSHPVVVRIDIEGVWGTGVVCGAKRVGENCQVLIVTCRHVIERKLSTHDEWVHVMGESSSIRYDAKILFAADEGSAYDIAFIKVSSSHSKLKNFMLGLLCYSSNLEEQLFIAPTCPISGYAKGSPVYVKGFGLFDSRSDLGPLFFHGVISSIVRHKNIPVLLHSTCLVHKGISGGALTCSRSGRLKGIVVNHIKDEDNATAYPDANFSIPCNVFMLVVQEYLSKNNRFTFECLNCYDKEIASKWNMDVNEHFKSCSEQLRSKL